MSKESSNTAKISASREEGDGGREVAAAGGKSGIEIGWGGVNAGLGGGCGGGRGDEGRRGGSCPGGGWGGRGQIWSTNPYLKMHSVGRSVDRRVFL